MSRLEWNLPGERLFEAGVDRGVLYPKWGSGVAWNGLISIDENTVGGELDALHFDGIKYADIVASEDFQATLTAFSAPAAFAGCDGSKLLAPGLFATQQPRETFDLSYRTLIGNDLESTEYGYKIHLVWNCTAAPSGRSNQTIAATTVPNSRSWVLHTVPPPSSIFKPTAHLVVDSTTAYPENLAHLESLLYGEYEDFGAYLPSVSEVISVLGGVSVT